MQHSSWLGLASVPGALETRPAVLMKKEDVQPQEKEEEELEEELPSKPVPKKSLFEVTFLLFFTLPKSTVRVHIDAKNITILAVKY